MTIENEKTTKSNTPWWQPGIQLFLKLSGWIAGPVLVAVFVGKSLDRTYHTEPWLFLFSVGISFVISISAIIFHGLKEMKRIETEAEELKKSRNTDN